MRIATILSFSGENGRTGRGVNLAGKASRNTTRRIFGSSSYVEFDVLGQSILDRTLAKLNNLSTLVPTIIGATAKFRNAPKKQELQSEWERAVAHYVQEGVDVLLLLHLNAYTDLDYSDFLNLHLQTGSALTQVCAADGALEVSLVDASLLRNATGNMRKTLNTMMPRQQRYIYSGYTNRLSSPHDFYQLLEDGLTGKCGLAPLGTEIREGVWAGPDVEIDSTASISGPVFLGARTRISAACEITGPASIEHDCEIDCGTVVHKSHILGNSYVGAALDVRASIVKKEKLFHLERAVEVNIVDSRLMSGNNSALGLLASLGARFRSLNHVS